jgi:hypothetical protein
MAGDSWQVVLKVFGFSLGFSLFLKYGAPYLVIPPLPVIALTFVLLPTVIVGTLLLSKLRHS